MIIKQVIYFRYGTFPRYKRVSYDGNSAIAKMFENRRPISARRPCRLNFRHSADFCTIERVLSY